MELMIPTVIPAARVGVPSNRNSTSVKHSGYLREAPQAGRARSSYRTNLEDFTACMKTKPLLGAEVTRRTLSEQLLASGLRHVTCPRSDNQRMFQACSNRISTTT